MWASSAWRGSFALSSAPPKLYPPWLGLSLPHHLLLSHSCLEFLLDNGADPSLRDRQGYTAVHYAAAYGNRQNLELVRVGPGVGNGSRAGPSTQSASVSGFSGQGVVESSVVSRSRDFGDCCGWSQG